MSGVILGLSLFLLLIPAGLVIHYFIYGHAGILGVGGCVAAIFLIIALWARPTHFELTGNSFDIVFPLRKKSIPLSDISGARKIASAKDLKNEFGNLMRVGAGGFLGTFGILVGRKKGSLDAYTSRVDNWVLIERISKRWLLISPEQPDRMIELLQKDKNP